MASGYWRLVLVGVVVWVGVGAQAQGTAAAPAAAPAAANAGKACSVNRTAPTPAEQAMNLKQYSKAEGLFREVLAKSPQSAEVHEGLVRALLEQDKVEDAAKDAAAWLASSPGDSMAMVAQAEVLLRQGQPYLAIVEFRQAARADLCNARAFYGLAEVDGLAGLHATAKRAIEQAYALHPTDDDIEGWWIGTRQRAERLAKWQDYAEHSDQISEEDRATMKTWLAKQMQEHTSDCRMAPSSPREAKVPMTAIMDGPYHQTGLGLDVKFNGSHKVLQLDTGASGITISRAAAMFLGLQREDRGSTGGIGDKAEVRTSLIHVASIKIGGIEFTNCAVDILEKFGVLDSDGLIGGDVFSESALTLDFPKRELRIAPLPLRPGDKPPNPALDAAGDDQDEVAHDPYIAPEMAQWLRVYRSGHDLLMPTGLVDTKRVKDDSAWKDALFLLDTGSVENLISPAAARSVTKVSRDWESGIQGIQGEVDKVYDAGKFTLQFAGLRLTAPGMTSIDTTRLSHDDGVEISGLIGAPALFQMALHIDYRDNLVWCEYSKPK